MIKIIPDCDLSSLNTFGMRVKCKKWIEFSEPSDLLQMGLKDESSHWKLIGGGSNVLFIQPNETILIHSTIKGVDISDPDSEGIIYVRIGSGEVFDDVIALLAQRGFWGAENLSGIPGQVGAGAVQNVGAYGIEMKDILHSVEVFDISTEQFKEFSVEECNYGYRDSRFKHYPDNHNYIITHVTIRVTEKYSPHLNYGSLDKSLSSSHPTPLDVRETVIATRGNKLPDIAVQPFFFSADNINSGIWPVAAGSAGSYFKNPVVTYDEYCRIVEQMNPVVVPHYMVSDGMVKIPAAWLIEQCGFKGYFVGNVGVWYKQPLILVNLTGQATPDEILLLEREIIEGVKSKFSISLSPEVEKV